LIKLKKQMIYLYKMFYIFILILILILIIKRKWIMSLFTDKQGTKQGTKQGAIGSTGAIQGAIQGTIQGTIGATQSAIPTVFAINDNGNFDLMDENGKILNIGFGPNQKVYINLLDQSEKDTDKLETEHGVQFVRKVDTKVYEIGGRPYSVNFTRL